MPALRPASPVASPPNLPPGVTVRASSSPPDTSRVLTPAAISFLALLHRAYAHRVTDLLSRRAAVQAAFDAGAKPHFLPHTAHVREGHWTVAPLPADIRDRRVEITGPPERKMVINALNSGASVFMADFEDANAPTWANQVTGQANLMDAVRRCIDFTDSASGKRYALVPSPAVLFVRPRGWHLPEAHFVVDGAPTPGALFDFGLYFFHNARELVARGTGPYFYLPKMQSHLEARLWNDMFLTAQHAVGLPHATIKATVLIETLPAAFEMDEILYELKDHSAGLNCGRWDYIFSLIKTMREDPAAVVPDRGVVTMTQPCMRAYSALLIKTCHRRKVHAMGGMAAQIPVKNDPAANAAALDKVKADKTREAEDGHDGTWVAHPALVGPAKAVFDQLMPSPNQIASKPRLDVAVSESDLLAVPVGPKTAPTLRHNVVVGVLYIEAWLRGHGCVPLFGLMEDAATAEICRTQVWQWIRHGAVLEGASGPLTVAGFNAVLDEEMKKLRAQVGDAAWSAGEYVAAVDLFRTFSTSPRLADFLTVPAYERLAAADGGGAFAKM